MMTLEKFEEASELVKRVTNPTKLIRSEYLSEQTGGNVYLKPENMQHTGAYKIRGAYYKISTMTEEERSRGLITASAGNHAQGVAFAAKKFGCKAVIVMPTVTPLIKVNRTKSYGAEVVLYGDVYDDSYAYARELAEKEGYTFVHPFNDLDVATGQGTIAMEIVQELPTVDYIIVPVGGGGLISGVATLAKMLNPKIKVIGVEPSEAASMTAALKAGEVVELDSANTIADGTAVKAVGDKILPYVQENVDDMLLVEDDESLNQGITLKLKKEGYRVSSAFSLEEAEELFDSAAWDLLICDVGLPDGSGLDFCRRVRRVSDVYILFLTALDSEIDMVTAYDLGADDYMTKPFSLMVLVSKVHAFMRRTREAPASRIVSGDILLSLREMKAFRQRPEGGAEPVPLSKKELQLLLLLMENACQILTKEQILERVWGVEGQFVDDNTVPVNISRLKGKLGGSYIQNVRGIGYIWTEESFRE